MIKRSNKISTIGIVLSSLPGYSETFFRNKIKGLQEDGFNVVIFVENRTKQNERFQCKVVFATNFGGSKFQKIGASFVAALKLLFLTPKTSIKLFKLDFNDGLSVGNCLKNLLLNNYFLNERLDWLHFGFGMLAHNRENVAKAINAKMAVSFRGFDLYLSPLKHDKCYEQLFKKQSKYHVLSNAMKSKLIDGNVHESNIHVITPAIDVQKFQYREPKPIEDTVTIVCVSRLHWIKGLDYLLEAMHELGKRNVKFRLKIIGDGEEYERLVFSAYQLKISEHVDLLGRLSQDEVISELKSSDIYVQYSIQEGFGNAVLEAQAMGLFCVVSDADGLRENVLHQITGLVVPKRQPKLLAKNIMDVINMDASKKTQIIKYAAERVQKEFNLERQKTLFLEFYNN